MAKLRALVNYFNALYFNRTLIATCEENHLIFSIAKYWRDLSIRRVVSGGVGDGFRAPVFLTRTPKLLSRSRFPRNYTFAQRELFDFVCSIFVLLKLNIVSTRGPLSNTNTMNSYLNNDEISGKRVSPGSTLRGPGLCAQWPSRSVLFRFPFVRA